jgi:hypothetical protein
MAWYLCQISWYNFSYSTVSLLVSNFHHTIMVHDHDSMVASLHHCIIAWCTGIPPITVWPPTHPLGPRLTVSIAKAELQPNMLKQTQPNQLKQSPRGPSKIMAGHSDITAAKANNPTQIKWYFATYPILIKLIAQMHTVWPPTYLLASQIHCSNSWIQQEAFGHQLKQYPREPYRRMAGHSVCSAHPFRYSRQE